MDLEQITTDAADADDLERRLIRHSRKSRTELTERGVNVLFVALGFLKWYEADQSEEAHLAPLVMIPVELKRESGSQPYKLHRFDDPITFNHTLVEKMRVEFGLSMPDVPEDEEGIDIEQVFTDVREKIQRQRRWEVQEEVSLATFTFLKLSLYRELQQYGDAYL